MKKFLVLACMMVMVFAASSAYAVATLQLFDGSTTKTIEDGSVVAGLVDANPGLGVVTWVGTIGNWNINTTTGVNFGTSTAPYIDLNSVNASTSAGGTLVLKFSEVGFTGPNGFEMGIGGTTAGTVDYKGYYSTSNTLFALSNLIDEIGPLGPGAFSGTGGGSAASGVPYSLTELVTITHRGSGLSSFDAELKAVPEPGTMMLLGSGLVGLAGWGRKKFRK